MCDDTIWPYDDDKAERQEVAVWVKLTYDADASLSRDELGQQVHDDIVRLEDPDSESHVELVSWTLLKLAEEAEIYGTAE